MKWPTARARTRSTATSQSRKLDKGGIVYRLDPTTLDVTQIIHNDIKPFGAAVNAKTGTLFFGNTVNNSVTAIDAKTGDVKGRTVLDARKRSETVKPLAPRELVADADSDTLYITGLGESSVVWVVDGKDLTLRATVTDTGKYGTGGAGRRRQAPVRHQRRRRAGDHRHPIQQGAVAQEAG